MNTLNLGILAHVDAGKTSLTERLLYAAGAIDEIGRVDDGSTQTDSMDLERARGITIRSAVVSFVVQDVTVNLIDTPGHSDFIAEVERVLGVLDGVVLVVSAVEGVQSQTRVLMRTLQRLRIPTLIFVNKIDRTGARHESLFRSIAEKLSPAVVAMGSTTGLGTRDAAFACYGEADVDFTSTLVDVLAARDDALLAAYVDDAASVSYRRLRHELAAQTRRALVHPVYFGSAITGAGVDSLMSAIPELLPAADGDDEAPASGSVFKIERGPAGEKIAYVRMFAGTVRVRDRLSFGAGRDGKVTAISAVTREQGSRGATLQSTSVSAGHIAKLWGLADVRIGDAIGQPRPDGATVHGPGGGSGIGGGRYFAPPTLETVVVPARERDRGALHVALTQLAEQDPLINLRQNDRNQDVAVSLYGEVQKEVVQATLADEYGIDATFRESTTICIERPIGPGEAVEILNTQSNPFRATIGLRIDPAPAGSGIEFRLCVDNRAAPLYIYKNLPGFGDMMEQYVRQALHEGLRGWQVTDCVVSMTRCTYSSADGPPSTRGPLSTAADFRLLTPLVVMRALERGGTRVYEPMHRFRLELPADTLGGLLPVLARLRAVPEAPTAQGPSYVLEGAIPAAQVHRMQQRLPALTRGEGVLETDFDRYQPVHGAAPTRPRLQPNPLDRKEYLRQVLHRA